MKVSRLLLLAILIISQGVATSIAGSQQLGSTIVIEYEEVESRDFNPETGEVEESWWAFEVKLIIESEEDGTWRKGNRYTIDFLLTVSFINLEKFDYLNFTNLRIQSQSNLVEMVTDSEYIFITSTNESQQYVENLFEYHIARSVATPKEVSKAKLIIEMDIGARLSGSQYNPTWGRWHNWHKPFYISVLETEMSITMPVLYLSLGIILGVSLTSIYVRSKNRKKAAR